MAGTNGWLSRTFKSSLGSKFVMALTGLALSGFLIVHLSGNLLVFAGPEAINTYAKNLHANGLLVWGGRSVILVAFLLHVVTALRLARANRAARPVAYKFRATVQATLASRTMVQTGLLIFAFVLYHLAHFTWKLTHPEYLQLDPYDLYTMITTSFKNPILTGLYLFALVMLAMHVRHGISSLFQSLGLNHEKYNKAFRLAGPLYAVVIVGGFMSIPLAVMFGIIG